MEPYQKLSEIYSTYWGDFCLQYLDVIEFMEKEYRFTPGRILDISCGTGELARELHKRGFQVIGSDISESMIEVARNKSEGIDYLVSDMAEVQTNSKFNLIISAFDSINYLLDTNHLRKAFSNISKHLCDEGYFVFDINTELMYKRNHHGVMEQEYGNMIVTKILSYDREEKIAKTVFEFGNIDREEHKQKAYSKSQMVKLLTDTGFDICKVIKDFDFSDYDSSATRIIFIAKKYSKT